MHSNMYLLMKLCVVMHVYQHRFGAFFASRRREVDEDGLKGVLVCEEALRAGSSMTLLAKPRHRPGEAHRHPQASPAALDPAAPACGPACPAAFLAAAPRCARPGATRSGGTRTWGVNAERHRRGGPRTPRARPTRSLHARTQRGGQRGRQEADRTSIMGAARTPRGGPERLRLRDRGHVQGGLARGPELGRRPPHHPAPTILLRSLRLGGAAACGLPGGGGCAHA